MKKKILKTRYPFITSFPTHANMLAILSGNPKNLDWFYNYYFQLSVDTDYHTRLDFDIAQVTMSYLNACPYIDLYKVPRNFVKNKYSALKDFVIKTINEGLYLSFQVERNEIPAYNTTRRGAHEIMLYGYDMDQCIFHIADFFTGKYEFATATFEEVTAGFENCTSDWFKGVLLFKKNRKAQYGINITRLKSIMTDYLTSQNTNKLIDHDLVMHNVGNKIVYGIEIYDELKSNLVDIMKKGWSASAEAGWITHKNYHVLYDHKSFILSLLDRLNNGGFLKNYDYFRKEFTAIQNKALVLRNLIIKCFAKNDMKDPDKFYRAINEIKNLELEIIPQLIECMTETPVLPEKTGLIDFNLNTKSACTAEYIGIDKITQGNWAGCYGKSGYDIICEDSYFDKHIFIEYNGGMDYLYSESIYEKRALQTVDNESERIAAVKYHHESFSLDIGIDNDSNTIVSFYFIDIDYFKRSMTIEITNPISSTLLCKYKLDDFANGIYVKFNITGHVRVRFINDNEDVNAVLSGVFFD